MQSLTDERRRHSVERTLTGERGRIAELLQSLSAVDDTDSDRQIGCGRQVTTDSALESIHEYGGLPIQDAVHDAEEAGRAAVVGLPIDPPQKQYMVGPIPKPPPSWRRLPAVEADEDLPVSSMRPSSGTELEPMHFAAQGEEQKQNMDVAASSAGIQGHPNAVEQCARRQNDSTELLLQDDEVSLNACDFVRDVYAIRTREEQLADLAADEEVASLLRARTARAAIDQRGSPDRTKSCAPGNNDSYVSKSRPKPSGEKLMSIVADAIRALTPSRPSSPRPASCDNGTIASPRRRKYLPTAEAQECFFGIAGNRAGFIGLRSVVIDCLRDAFPEYAFEDRDVRISVFPPAIGTQYGFPTLEAIVVSDDAPKSPCCCGHIRCCFDALSGLTLLCPREGCTDSHLLHKPLRNAVRASIWSRWLLPGSTSLPRQRQLRPRSAETGVFDTFPNMIVPSVTDADCRDICDVISRSSSTEKPCGASFVEPPMLNVLQMFDATSGLGHNDTVVDKDFGGVDEPAEPSRVAQPTFDVLPVAKVFEQNSDAAGGDVREISRSVLMAPGTQRPSEKHLASGHKSGPQDCDICAEEAVEVSHTSLINTSRGVSQRTNEPVAPALTVDSNTFAGEGMQATTVWPDDSNSSTGEIPQAAVERVNTLQPPMGTTFGPLSHRPSEMQDDLVETNRVHGMPSDGIEDDVNNNAATDAQFRTYEVKLTRVASGEKERKCTLVPMSSVIPPRRNSMPASSRPTPADASFAHSRNSCSEATPCSASGEGETSEDEADSEEDSDEEMGKLFRINKSIKRMSVTLVAELVKREQSHRGGILFSDTHCEELKEVPEHVVDEEEDEKEYVMQINPQRALREHLGEELACRMQLMLRKHIAVTMGVDFSQRNWTSIKRRLRNAMWRYDRKRAETLTAEELIVFMRRHLRISEALLDDHAIGDFAKKICHTLGFVEFDQFLNFLRKGDFKEDRACSRDRRGAFTTKAKRAAKHTQALPLEKNGVGLDKIEDGETTIDQKDGQQDIAKRNAMSPRSSRILDLKFSTTEHRGQAVQLVGDDHKKANVPQVDEHVKPLKNKTNGVEIYVPFEAHDHTTRKSSDGSSKISYNRPGRSLRIDVKKAAPLEGKCQTERGVAAVGSERVMEAAPTPRSRSPPTSHTSPGSPLQIVSGTSSPRRTQDRQLHSPQLLHVESDLDCWALTSSRDCTRDFSPPGASAPSKSRPNTADSARSASNHSLGEPASARGPPRWPQPLAANARGCRPGSPYRRNSGSSFGGSGGGWEHGMARSWNAKTDQEHLNKVSAVKQPTPRNIVVTSQPPPPWKQRAGMGTTWWPLPEVRRRMGWKTSCALPSVLVLAEPR